ncbi:MAG: glycosyltransferase family 39 protein [Desulfobacterales bacterium]|nr:glycosyltransferase family 39 protein [Desulfobacterales bacterium]
MLIAACVRLVGLVDFTGSLYGDFLIWDEQVYHQWASSLVDDSVKSLPVRDFTPLPAYAMAALYALFSPDPQYFRYFNLLLGVLTCGLIYFIGMEISGRAVGFGSGFAAALYKPFIFFSVTALKSSLSVFLFAMVVLLFLRCLKIDRPMHTLLLGVFAGLFINVRANFVLALPLLPVLLAWHRCRLNRQWTAAAMLVGTYLVGLVISTAPFVVKNYRETGQMALTAAGGFNLYLANNPDNPCPYYRPVPFAVSTPAFQATQFTIEASRRSGRRLSSREASAFWTREVFDRTRDRPGWFVGKLFQKVLALFNRFESADNYDIDFISRFVTFFSLPFFCIGLMIPLGMAGILRAMIKKERSAVHLFLISFVYASTLVLFFTNIRIRLPLLVVWIPYAVYGLWSIIEDICQYRAKAAGLFLGMVLFFAIISRISLSCSDDLTGHYNTHAVNLMRKGREAEAISFWKASAEMEKPYSAYANLSLAGYYFNRGFPEKALGYLDRIPDSSFAAAQRYERIGDLLLPGNVGGAVAAYEKSLSNNSGQLEPRMKLLRLFKRYDPRRAEIESQKIDYVASFYNAKDEK